MSADCVNDSQVCWQQGRLPHNNDNLIQGRVLLARASCAETCPAMENKCHLPLWDDPERDAFPLSQSHLKFARPYYLTHTRS